MPVFFNSLLAQLGLTPETVILLRHQDKRALPGRTPYELWRDNRPGFEDYQSYQTFDNRSKFTRAPHWASFVATPSGATMFVGLYTAEYRGVLTKDASQPHNDEVQPAGRCDVYNLRLNEHSTDLEGRLFIEWGDGTRAWVQRADNQNKLITEVHAEFKEPDFPGLLKFRKPLSEVAALPKTWIAVLKQATGVYLLTCPKTREQYVGSACGDEGFWQRWMEYVTTGHGSNVALKSREYSDYQASILEVAGSSANPDDIRRMESNWKEKLQSREMGLNRN